MLTPQNEARKKEFIRKHKTNLKKYGSYSALTSLRALGAEPNTEDFPPITSPEHSKLLQAAYRAGEDVDYKNGADEGEPPRSYEQLK